MTCPLHHNKIEYNITLKMKCTQEEPVNMVKRTEYMNSKTRSNNNRYSEMFTLHTW